MPRRLSVFATVTLLALAAGSSPARSGAPWPEWTATPGTNPAVVAWLDPGQANRVSLTTTLLPDPLELTYSAGYAVHDSGWGAAALSVVYSRVWLTGAVWETTSYAYSWARRWRPHLAAGATVRLAQSQYLVETGLSTPLERGPGLDLGALYRPDDQAWVGLAVQDAFDTTLRSDGGTSSVYPMSLQVSFGRQVGPDLRLTVEGRDVTENTAGGSLWKVGAAITRGNLTYRAAALAGATPGWSAGVAIDSGPCRIDLAVDRAGERTGGTLGVTARW